VRRSSFLSLTILLAVAVAAGCTPAAGATWTFRPKGETAALPSAPAAAGVLPTPAPTPAVAAPATGSALEISAFDLGFTPKMAMVPAPGRYALTFKNTGAMPHDLTFPDGTTTGPVDAGKSATVDVDVPAAGLTFLCSIPGHAAAGMTGSIGVEGAPAASADSHGGPPPDTGTVKPDPAAPKYTPYDATAPKVLTGTTHDIDLVVKEMPMTVGETPEGGYVQAVWTFNGTVPGPVIRVHLGDKVRIHLKNPATSKLAHSVDFHASQVAWNDEMTSINPGEEKLYEWTADYAGVWMYHCGTAPALHHIANGMYGMVIVEPKGGLPPVDHEFALVQNEWYLGAQGQPADLAKASVGNPSPDFVAFNGVKDQYKDHPLQVATGKTVRVFILDAGPNIDSSFHIVGTIFNTVVKEGIALTPGNAGHYGSQAVDLSPAQGAYVEFTTAEDGLYPIVTHAFNFVGRGALGLVQAGDGDPLN
jgi:nitrite reductase (NO-forming)